MRRQLILIVSVGLNLVLAAVLFSSRRHPAPVPAEADTNPPPAATMNDVRVKVVARKQFFSWQELESPEYAVYIARLREIGCPEQTIRDIVIADVGQLYARKRQKEVVTPDEQWWRSTPDTNVIAAARAKIQALDQERRTLLTTLLGPGWDSGNSVNSITSLLSGPVLGELAPEAKQSVQDIITRYDRLYKDAGKSGDRAALAHLRQEARQELAKVLNPAQLEEFFLRYSETAVDLRSKLNGAEVTPEEFRNLFRARDAINQQRELLTGDDPNSVAQRAALNKQLDETIKTALGKDRYQALQLAQDPAYRDAVAYAKQAGLPTEAIQGLYELNKATMQEQNRIRNDDSLTQAQKDDQLKAVEQQQQSARDQLLGVAPVETPEAIIPPGLTATPTQTHAYAPGETLDQIAAQYGVSTDSILKVNSNLDINRLQKGTPIRIPIPTQ